MLELLTGTGLASAAGLNAYIPLLTVGLLARYTDLLPLGEGWQWLEHPAVLGVLGVLLVLELAADKIPAVDSLNDVVQTLVRPTSGGITFGAGAGASSASAAELAALADGASGGDTGAAWWQIASGVLIALVFHLLKASARPVLNAVTFGAGGPVVSAAEDVASALTSVAAVVVPVLGAVAVVLLAAVGLWARRRRRRRRGRESAAAPGVP
ncbi:membrane protein [Streptomonospora alba]|uniref:Membrane protein n=1 Tax=Streptomonospora alba TaxID=183763 RepID=A0A0C2JD36_9ACTN|nr:DUF4126 domain-containing protein [Streptomonospora alba]KIH96860.1 membrane protein [Streptomonospora alba]